MGDIMGSLYKDSERTRKYSTGRWNAALCRAVPSWSPSAFSFLAQACSCCRLDGHPAVSCQELSAGAASPQPEEDTACCAVGSRRSGRA